MKKITKKRLTISLLLLTLLLEVSVTLRGQEYASATWPFDVDMFPLTTGNINAFEATSANTYEFFRVAPEKQILIYRPNSSDPYGPESYIQFKLAPLPGQDFYLNSLSMAASSYYSNCRIKILYSTSTEFSTFIPLGPEITITTDFLNEYGVSDLNILVEDGSSLYLRIYFTYLIYSGYIRLDYFQAMGHTESSSSPSIQYSQSSYCSGEGTAEVVLIGNGGGTYSSSPGLAINASTGSIDLANSLPGFYTVSYSNAGQIVATTDVTIHPSPDCTITGPDRLLPSSIYTFTAPEGMAVYNWLVTGNAAITSNTNEQTVTVEAGASGGASFTLWLTAENENGCTNSCSKEINVEEASPGMLPTATLTGTQSVCAGGSADLVVSLTGQAPWTFTWTDGVSEYTVTETYDPQHVITVNPTGNTTYSLTGLVYDGNGYSNTGTGEARIYFGPITTAPHIIACSNTTVEVPITVKSFSEVRDISLTLKYDPGVMTYLGYENGDITFGEGEIGNVQVNDYAYEGFRVIFISMFSIGSLPSLEDDAELLRLKFDFIGGNTELEWLDSPDDSWCSYSYLSTLDETGFETEAFCDVPTETYYVSGSVKQLSISGIEMSPIANVSTITGTPVIIPVSVIYPDLAAHEVNSEVLTDLQISYNGAGIFPAGTRIFKVLCNGISVLSTPFYIGEKSEALLSEILGTTAAPLLNHSDQIVNWEFYIDGIMSHINLPVTIEALVYTNLIDCVKILDTESFNAIFAGAALSVTESVTVCGNESLQFAAEIEYPNIINLNAAIKADAKIIAANAFPEGTIINWNYNSSSNGSYILPVITAEIMLSTIVGTLPNPLQGHSGIDAWTFEISHAGLMTANDLKIEAVAVLDGEYYIHSEDHVTLTVHPLPEITAVSLLTSTNEINWTGVSGSLSAGYYMCADPAENFHYLDIDALIGSAELNSDFEKNAFYLNGNSVPTEFYEYWNTRGVNASATDGWQAVMWNIITGVEPMFYISYNGTDYRLIDGLQYRNSNVISNLRISGDYPAGRYTFSGTVTDVNGCVSEIFPVTLNLSSAPVILCPGDVEVYNNAGECGAEISFEAKATGNPAPEIVYTLSDGTQIAPVYFFPVGTATVTATASNNCKTVACTFNVTVIDSEAPDIICPVSGNAEATINNPSIYLHSGNGWDPSASDNCSVTEIFYTLSGVTAGTGTSLDGTSFNLGTTTVIWKATDAAGNADECSFTVTVSGVNLTGTVRYYNEEGTHLDNLTVSLLEPATGNIMATSTTTFDGKYSFTNLYPTIYDVHFDTDKPMRSINSTDAGQVNAWNVAQSGNIWPLIEKVRFLAGNVNEDDYVDSGDAGMIQNYFLTLGTEVTFDNRWEFWKINDPVTAQPQTDKVLQVEILSENNEMIQDFYGLVSGDFNRSNIPASDNINSLFIKSARSEEGSVTLLKGDTLIANADEMIELPIRAVSAMQVGAISLILEFPTDQLQVVDVFLKDNPNQPAGFNVMNNMLIIGWNSVNPIAMKAGEPMLTLSLKFIGENKTMPVFFDLVSDPLNELADENMIAINNASLIMDGFMIKETITGIESTDRSALMLTCYPNPFGDYASIKYTLPMEGYVSLEITGMLGKRISILSNHLQSAGEYLMDLNGINLVPGVYHIVLRLTDQNGQPKVTTATLVKQ